MSSSSSTMANPCPHEDDPCHDPSGSEKVAVIVVAVPFPAQGHLSPLLCFSSLLSSSGIPVHYVGSTTHIRQARLRANWLGSTTTTNPNSNNIQFHEFSIPPFSNPPPNPNSSKKFPAHLQASFDASLHLQDPVASLLRALSPKARRIAVVHDEFMASVVQDAASISNAETFAFHTSSVFTMLSYKLEFGYNNDDGDSRNIVDSGPPPLDEFSTPEFLDFMTHQAKFSDLRVGDLFNTCRVFEGDHVNLFGTQLLAENKKHYWAVVPLIPLRLTNIIDHVDEQDIFLRWLNQKEPKSVLFVSFGTTTSVEEEQIHQLAVGLEESGIDFVWVLRDADKGGIFDTTRSRSRSNQQLPEGYQERISSKGMVVSHWVPQMEILGHPSVGGFMTHCGWNSCKDSIAMGVAVAAWPMHSDQPANTILVTELLKIGIVARQWSQRDNIVKSSAIKEVVRRLMASDEGDEIRKRAAKLGTQVRHAVEEGGISHKELSSHIEFIII